MGWTSTNKPYDVAGWIKDSLTWQSGDRSNTCLDVAIVHRTAAYAAVETVHADGTREVWAAVYLLRFMPRDKEGHTFSYKDIAEHSGPNEIDCPARILDRLTPTDSKWANEWREKCRSRLARRSQNRLEDGDCVRFERKLRFEGYGEFDTFRFAPERRKAIFIAMDEDGNEHFRCRISHWRDRVFVKLDGNDLRRADRNAPGA